MSLPPEESRSDEEESLEPLAGDAPLPEDGDEGEDPLLRELAEAFGDAVVTARAEPSGETVLLLARESAAEVFAALKERHRYSSLTDLCGVDDPAADPRFTVVYHLYSFRENRRLRVKVAAGEGEAVPSVAALWPAADWLEREVWDLFGIPFDGREATPRLLLWEGFDGHPLRKDFPLAGVATGAALYPDYFEAGAAPERGKVP